MAAVDTAVATEGMMIEDTIDPTILLDSIATTPSLINSEQIFCALRFVPNGEAIDNTNLRYSPHI